MKSKRFQDLAIAVAGIYTYHQDEIAALPLTSPRGGSNARNIEGWVQSPCAAVSKIVRREGWAHLDYWSGKNPTPSTAVPACAYAGLLLAYNNIYKGGPL